MKTFFLSCLAVGFVLQVDAQEKIVSQQYYRFESTCSHVFTTNNSSVLTLYADSSFLLEMFSNKRGGGELYRRTKLSGKWKKQKDTISFQYLDREVKAITRNGGNVFSSDQALFMHVPAYYVTEGDELVTNSTFTNNLHVSKNKALALCEKWAYENAQRTLNSPKNNFLKLK